MRNTGPELESVARPKQARSEQTLQRILDAAEGLIEEKGLADASIPEIVRRAGSSVGGFYARFRDKDELLRALEERFFVQLSERLERLLEPARSARARLGDLVRPFVEELVRVTHRRAPLIAAFIHRAIHDPALREGSLRFRRSVTTRLSGFLLARRGEIHHPEPEVAIDLAVQLAFGLMIQRVVFGEIRAGGRHLSDTKLVDELVHGVLGYLGVNRAATA
jgi:AcrR family transcriptional regulator